MVRLAKEQGLLNQQDLNSFQHWALSYWIYMDRRIINEDKQFDLEQQCWHLNPERWTALYYDNYFGNVAAGEDMDVPVTDLDEIDRFMASLEGKRWARGTEVEEPVGQDGEWI